MALTAIYFTVFMHMSPLSQIPWSEELLPQKVNDPFTYRASELFLPQPTALTHSSQAFTH